MNKKLFTYQSWLLKITMITFWGVVFCQCKSDNDLPEPDSPEPEGEIPLITKAAFDDYFEWDRLDKFPIYNPNIGLIILNYLGPKVLQSHWVFRTNGWILMHIVRHLANDIIRGKIIGC
mgnify:CR=1 FL=1